MSKFTIKHSSSTKFFYAILAFSLLQMSLTQIATAKPAPALKPATPAIEKVISTKSGVGRYNLKVYVSVEKGKGKNRINLTRISASGKSCYVPITKKSCVLKNLSTGKSVKIYAKSKNRSGYGVASAPLTYKVGRNNWYRIKASAVTTESQNQIDNSINLPVVEPIVIEPIEVGPATILADNQFIHSIKLSGINPEALNSISFEISPKVGTYAKPISAQYSKRYMIEKNYLDVKDKSVDVPVFGLYQDYENIVSLTVKSTNDSQTVTKQITTPRYAYDRYLNPEKVVTRDPNISLDFDAMLLKNWRTNNSPVIIDTDGELRWIGNSSYVPKPGSMFIENQIVSSSGSSLIRQNLDGSTELIRDYALLENVTNSGHHNYDIGKNGILIEVDAKNQYDPSITDVESILLEVDPDSGEVIKKFDFGEIIASAIGNTNSEFVRPGVDWFHMNAAAYWPAQNEIVVSSRENFVIAVDYDSLAIKWILGDPSKYWHTFPGLATHALNLAGDSRVPIGQHAVSITSDEKVMLFDNGFPSMNQPIGESVGESRSYSAPRQYSIDRVAMTATESWSFENEQSVHSPICSSIYQYGHSYLIDYASEGFPNPEKIRLIGLDSDSNRAFEYRFPGNWTDGWNAQPLELNSLKFE